jgi:superfamily II DNA/RNA helicase
MNHPAPSSGPSRRDGRRRSIRPSNPQAARLHTSPPTPASVGVAVDLTISSTLIVHATDFAVLGVPAAMIAVLARTGVITPFPIQSATLPDSMAGRDLLGRGKTGSGKTIAFAIPTVTALVKSAKRRQPSRPRALILVPTRELANQVAETITPLAVAMGLKVTTVFGGVGQNPQVNALKAGIDILVACPGRLEDLIQQRHCKLDMVEVTVLDEADHMADLGFLPGVKRLLDQTPAGTQRLLFSATLDNGIDILVRRYLSNPSVHSVDPEVSPISTMTHHIVSVSAADKLAVVTKLASGLDRSLLFMRTKHGAKKLAKQLIASGIPAVELHGNLSQNARERNLESFSDGSTRVLVATDIAARGIHVDDIALVVHVDPPAEHKAFLHRSGRTARAGAEGIVVTVMMPEQTKDVRDLARAAGISPIVTKVEPGHPLLHELAGPAAPHVTPAPVATVVHQPAGRAGRSASMPARTSQRGNQSRYGGPARASAHAPSGRPQARRPR